MSSERHTYPGRPSHCPGALRESGRVQHGGLVPTADIVREGPEGRTVFVSAAGLCSSCEALEAQEMRTREPIAQPRRGQR